jgi:hypothetical protein
MDNHIVDSDVDESDDDSSDDIHVSLLMTKSFIFSHPLRYVKLGVWNSILENEVALLFCMIRSEVLRFVMNYDQVQSGIRAWFDDVAPLATITQSHHM